MKSTLGRGQASIRELYNAYRDQIHNHRLEHVGQRTQQSGMCYESYRKLVWMARETNLIHVVGLGNEIPGLSMMHTSSAGELEVIPSAPVFHRLTDFGSGELLAWDNIPKFYQNQTMIDRGEAPAVPSLFLPADFSVRHVPHFRSQVVRLRNLSRQWGWPDNPWPEMAQEVRALAETALHYGMELSDLVMRALSINVGADDALLERLTLRRDVMLSAGNALESQDLQLALEWLENI